MAAPLGGHDSEENEVCNGREGTLWGVFGVGGLGGGGVGEKKQKKCKGGNRGFEEKDALGKTEGPKNEKLLRDTFMWSFGKTKREFRDLSGN